MKNRNYVHKYMIIHRTGITKVEQSDAKYKRKKASTRDYLLEYEDDVDEHELDDEV